MTFTAPSRALSSTRTSFWLEIVAVAGGIAFVLALAIAVVGTLAGVADAVSAAGQTKPAPVAEKFYDGMITDTRCGAKHSAVIGKAAADCTLACVHSGERFALVDGETVYALEGEPVALKRAAGQRVRIAGILNRNTLSVISVGNI